MKCKFKINQIIRYALGATAFMKVKSIHEYDKTYRYYGIQYFGGYVGAYEDSCKKATKEEIEQFKIEASKRFNHHNDR